MKNAVPPVSKVSESESSDDEYLYKVTSHKPPKVNVKVCQHWVKATVDTGATINFVDQETFSKMIKPNLNKTRIKAFAFDAKSPVRLVAKFEATIETRKRIALATFYVIKQYHRGSLFSATTDQDLGLTSLHLNKISNFLL